ncbi:hypothetical protein EDD16DRAFT_1520552 [Pisolithus croceorrhizus]|nr:hypothetical protein EDD16DRAFT_1520552 [Pisolithus croceorrhizus]
MAQKWLEGASKWPQGGSAQRQRGESQRGRGWTNQELEGGNCTWIVESPGPQVGDCLLELVAAQRRDKLLWGDSRHKGVFEEVSRLILYQATYEAAWPKQGWWETMKEQLGLMAHLQDIAPYHDQEQDSESLKVVPQGWDQAQLTVTSLIKVGVELLEVLKDVLSWLDLWVLEGYESLEAVPLLKDGALGYEKVPELSGEGQGSINCYLHQGQGPAPALRTLGVTQLELKTVQIPLPFLVSQGGEDLQMSATGLERVKQSVGVTSMHP